MINILHSNNLCIRFMMQIRTTLNILKTAFKLCEKVLMLLHDFKNTNPVTKVKVEHFHSKMKSHTTQQLYAASVNVTF